MHKIISGFSKLSKEKKIQWLVDEYVHSSAEIKQVFEQYWNDDPKIQKLHDQFSENTISNFYFPYGIAPNFKIDEEIYALPMVIEESSVVAAASNAAKFWIDKGGFKTKILGIEKLGHIHFLLNVSYLKFKSWFEEFNLKEKLIRGADDITKNMRNRGGGIISIELIDKTRQLDNYYQLKVSFNTKDSMGANFINTCLERFSKILENEIENTDYFTVDEKNSFIVVMSILSNYTPNCLVRAEVSCSIQELKDKKITDSKEFAYKFKQAIEIAKIEPYRATTHNKGIMNGVDAVVLATGNDFRAVEACVHTYASRNGQYMSLTDSSIEEGQFRFWLDLPIAIGVVGGLTNLHPLVRASLSILGNPSAEQLMRIIAVAGLAQNFSALKSLVTTGIQQGHMKMHLMNIFNQLKVSEEDQKILIKYFKDKEISYKNVAEKYNEIKKS